MFRIGIFVSLAFLTSCSTIAQSLREPSSVPSLANLELHTVPVPYGDKFLNVRVGIQNPTGTPIADILYIHGFGDRLDNHQPLFRTWAQAGFRVIAFDLPGHGENSGAYNELKNFSFRDLSNLSGKIEQDSKPEKSRPLILSGWSTGGHIVVRTIQQNWTSEFSRPISGAILFAPGISVRKDPLTFGDGKGNVTNASLTHDPHPPHLGSIKPDSPFWNKSVLIFTIKLLEESVASFLTSYPLDIPTLIFTGGETEDRYVNENKIHEWVTTQNLSRSLSNHVPIANVSCPHAMHELDNELASYGAEEVRHIAASFAVAIVSEKSSEFSRDFSTYEKICSH